MLPSHPGSLQELPKRFQKGPDSREGFSSVYPGEFPPALLSRFSCRPCPGRKFPPGIRCAYSLHRSSLPPESRNTWLLKNHMYRLCRKGIHFSVSAGDGYDRGQDNHILSGMCRAKYTPSLLSALHGPRCRSRKRPDAPS